MVSGCGKYKPTTYNTVSATIAMLLLMFRKETNNTACGYQGRLQRRGTQGLERQVGVLSKEEYNEAQRV